ncbi:unnamed protein product [Cuscuta campestris]|uniref:Uncharacterized protein n=1 Tax=Cuscuta campestris TaxID=132261 RepID=A0A484MI57_9ASTE|nr:unnamed protein product [Cuscuta campestris]
MGICMSKKKSIASAPPRPATQSAIHSRQETKSPDLETKKPEEGAVKKEIFFIKHRRSHEIERRSVDGKDDSKKEANNSEVSEPAVKNPSISSGLNVVSAPVRTSSCTKEEVDAILIQCGRLSRSPSRGKTAASISGSVGSSSENNIGSLQMTKKYSVSKRSFDFDKENGSREEDVEAGGGETERLHRQRHRQPRSSLSPSSSRSRRRTQSREREQGAQQQRSGSRERSGSNGRRVSRSPGKRSESPNTVTSGNGNRPGKMVHVPATVAMDKSIDGENILAVKRIQVKRNVGGSGCDGSRNASAPVVVVAASPRARSPAQNQQPPSLSRNNSRKAEQSPYRRNPLGEIDTNVVIEPSATNKPAKTHTSQVQKINGDNISGVKVALQGASSNKFISNNKGKDEEEQLIMEEEHKVVGGNGAAVNVIAPAGPENIKTVTRCRSSRLSRDLDINPESLLSNSNSNQNYTALLLEDIQNFHQKNTPNTTSAFSLPACVTKACSILDAVADLNSSTTNAFSEDRRKNFASEQFVKKKSLGVKDPFVESEVVVVGGDDLMEPSIHKYVTLRRGNVEEEEEGGDGEDQESSGSNSFVGGSQPPYWLSSSSSSWEPNSSDSTSRSYSRDDNRVPLGLGFQRRAVSEPSHDIMGEGKRRLAAKKNQQIGGGTHNTSMAAAAVTTASS